MKPGFWDYLRAAFSARPIGMYFPPNWVGLALFGLLGLLNPGFWLLGAGLECAYLYALMTNSRFQRVVAARQQSAARKTWEERRARLLTELAPEDLRRYRSLERRCAEILEHQCRSAASAAGLAEQSSGLGRLLWVYLRLLLTRRAIEKIVEEADAGEGARLEKRVGKLEGRLKENGLSEDLRKSLSGQLEILKQRLEKQREAREKLTFLEAELTRIQEQVELIREQAMLATDPETVSHRIDQITATLDGTSQWILDQQKIYGQVEDLLTEPPPLPVPAAQKESA
jgi:hypothetical protein